MSKLTYSTLAGANIIALISTINNNMAAIQTAFENTLSRDGTSPNQMTADFDMNSNQILNLPAATTSTEPVRKAEFDSLEERVDVLEAGGIGGGEDFSHIIDYPSGALVSIQGVEYPTYVYMHYDEANTLGLNSVHTAAVHIHSEMQTGHVGGLSGLQVYTEINEAPSSMTNVVSAGFNSVIVNTTDLSSFSGIGIEGGAASALTNGDFGGGIVAFEAATGVFGTSTPTTKVGILVTDFGAVGDTTRGSVWDAGYAISSLGGEPREVMFLVSDMSGAFPCDNTSTILRVEGSSTPQLEYGIDLNGATFAQSPIRIPNNHPMRGRNAANSADVDLVTINNANQVVVGDSDVSLVLNSSSNVFCPFLLPALSNTYSLGDTTHQWADAFLGDGAVLNFNNGNLTLTHSSGLLTNSGGFRSAGATSGIGYSTGAGGTVTQLTSKSTGVTLNKAVGRITMDAAALAANTTVNFTLTNSAIGSGDVLILNHVLTGALGSYLLNASCTSGSAVIYVRNTTAGSLSEAIQIQFVVIKGVNS